MNCDQVFDVLTRGPFPTGDPSDHEVERHLDRCYECARLAEALRPALDLIHESIPTEESRDLPGYWGELIGSPSSLRGPADPAGITTGEGGLATSISHRLRRRLSIGRGTRGRSALTTRVGRLAVAVLLGVSLGAILHVVGQSEIPLQQPLAAATWLTPTPPNGCFRLADADVSSESSDVLQVSEVKVAHSDQPTSRTDPETLCSQLTVCAGCHASGVEHWSPRAMTVSIATTCIKCHRFAVN